MPIAMFVAVAACGGSGGDDPSGNESSDGTGGGSVSTGDSETPGATEASGATNGDTGTTGSGDAVDGSSESSGDACPVWLNEDGIGDVTIHVTNVGSAPLWVAMNNESCYDEAIFISDPDGNVLDPDQPVCGGTCESLGVGDGGCPGTVCDEYRLMMLDPGEVALDITWQGIFYAEETVPEGCPEAGSTCHRAVAAQPGEYEFWTSISASATCGGGPCVCDGESDPCLVDDPTAMLDDPQVVSTTIAFPRENEVVLELAL